MLPAPAPDTSQAPTDPLSRAPEPPAEPPAPAQEVLLADGGVAAPAQSSGAFTPMRTMAVVAIVAAGAATGAGRAMTALNAQ